ncbi:MAG: lipoate--protein ligase family protein [Opitutaceae bacterium]|nr:lipoate--protein ligase family protein [Opitutaceae bacterium]
MKLHLLPDRTDSAAANMAADFLLLQRYPLPAVRFRHYGWHRPAFTFGYSQKIAFVRDRLPPGEPVELCRRPTGGGLVDHREDWTYALVIPRGHPAEELRATESYRLVHEALAAALRRQGVAAALQPAETEDTAASGVCFQRAEPHDVIHRETGAKIAGAAQKRNKRGLLFQGSLWRPAVRAAVDWARFQDDLAETLAAALKAEAAPQPWPEWAEHEFEGLTEQYASPEWIEAR